MTYSQKDLWRAGRLRALTASLALLACFAVLGVGRASAAGGPMFPASLQSASSIVMPPAENISSTIGAYEFGGGATSCGSAGFCASVTGYDSIAGSGVLVVPINNGVAAPAVQVALPANAYASGYGELYGISCWGADSCVAVGSYEAQGAESTNQALVVPITNGQVGTAVEVAPPASNVTAQDAGLGSVSCDPSGACVAVGSYVDGDGNTQAMIVPITGGNAGTAVEVAPPAGNAIDNSTGKQYAELNSVSCESSGACVAVGDYVDTSGNSQAMVVPVSSTGALGASTMLTLPSDASATDPRARLNDVSCPAAGSCAAIGQYNGSSSNEQLVTSISAAGLPLPAAQVVATLGSAESTTSAEANDVGCGVAGCDVVGAYWDTNGSKQPLVISVSGGASSTVLGSEVQVTLPGDAVQDATGNQSAWLSHISCSAAGSCLASGGYTADYLGSNQAFFTTEGSSNTNLNALLVGISGTTVDTGISAPLPSSADAYGRLSVGWGVGCGATGSCAVFAKYLQGFSTVAQLSNALSCLSGSYGDGNCLSSGSEQPYVISAQAPLMITAGSVPTTVTAGVTSVSLASMATGGWGPYQWSVANGNTLPDGLSLDPYTGVISGTPQAAGTYHLWVRADSPGMPTQNAVASLTLTVGAQTTTSPVTTTATIKPAVTSNRKPSLIVVRGNLRDHGGKVVVHLRCHSWARCNGMVKLRWHGHVISKAKRLSISAGRTAAVTVHLNASGMKDAASLRKPRHGHPTMYVTVVPTLKVGRGLAHGRPMWVI